MLHITRSFTIKAAASREGFIASLRARKYNLNQGVLLAVSRTRGYLFLNDSTTMESTNFQEWAVYHIDMADLTHPAEAHRRVDNIGPQVESLTIDFMAPKDLRAFLAALPEKTEMPAMSTFHDNARPLMENLMGMAYAVPLRAVRRETEARKKENIERLFRTTSDRRVEKQIAELRPV